MAIDVFSEHVVGFREAVTRLPRVRDGRKMHVATLYRWAKTGKSCPDGSVVRLETIKIGSSTCTSLEALQRFFERLTGEAETENRPTRSHLQWLKRQEEVEAQLSRLGV